MDVDVQLAAVMRSDLPVYSVMVRASAAARLVLVDSTVTAACLITTTFHHRDVNRAVAWRLEAVRINLSAIQRLAIAFANRMWKGENVIVANRDFLLSVLKIPSDASRASVTATPQSVNRRPDTT